MCTLVTQGGGKLTTPRGNWLAFLPLGMLASMKVCDKQKTKVTTCNASLCNKLVNASPYPQIAGHFMLSDGQDILQCILCGVERMERNHLHNALELGKVVDASLNLIINRGRKVMPYRSKTSNR